MKYIIYILTFVFAGVNVHGAYLNSNPHSMAGWAACMLVTIVAAINATLHDREKKQWKS